MSDLNFELQLSGARRSNFVDIPTVLACRVDDAGVRLIIQVVDTDGVPVNVRNADSLKIKLQYPDTGVQAQFDATVLTNGTDGKFYYETDNDDLDESGFYRIQGVIDMAGNVQATALGGFWVDPVIPDPGP